MMGGSSSSIELRHNSMTEHFRCEKCKDYLAPPISFCLEGHIFFHLCANNKNVCPQCGKQLSTKLNNFIECIVKDLKFPCKNTKNGCRQFYKWDEKLDHIIECNFRTFRCPIHGTQIGCGFLIVNCQWEGTVFDMKKHIDDAHTDLIKNVVDDCRVIFDINLSKKGSQIYPILEGKKLYLLHLMHTIEKTELKLNYVGIFENAENYEGELKLKHGDNNGELAYKLECKSLLNNDNNCAKEISNSVLAPFIIVDSVLKCSVKIITQKPISKSCDSILIEAECPICCEYMLTKIYVCHAGHSICERCNERVIFCPTCRGEMTQPQMRDTRNCELESRRLTRNYKPEFPRPLIRNYKLETLISKLQFPCKFKTKGCTNLVAADKIKEHEAECSFGKCKCPVSPCDWKGTQNQMLVHAKDRHTSWFADDDEWHETVINFNNKVLEPYIQIANVEQKMFICYYERNFEENLFCLVVQTYEQNEQEYYYTLEIGDKENRYIHAKEICTNYKEPKSEVISKKRCILLNWDHVATFVNDKGQLTCHETIKKMRK